MDYFRELTKLGFLVEENAVNIVKNLNEEEFKKLVDNLRKEKTFILTDSLIKNILTEDIRIIKIFEPIKTLSVQDYVKILNERYRSLQDILIKKLELNNVVSINKCGSGSVSVIGLVKTKEEKNEDYIVLLEDSTGEIKTIVPKNLGERLYLDDVIAFSGKINNKILFVERLLYPDVPLRPVNYSKESIKVAFLSNENDCDAHYCIYKNKVKDKIKNKTYNVTNPSIITINNIVILIVHGFDPLDILKKRYVNLENTDFIIEPIPDILFTDKDVNTNYKGISIVSKNKIIDLKTREVSNI